jgi:tetratricopeptide (TPR) repeat protein
MKPAVRSWFVSTIALGVAGCTYFNGMYNANRFARQAEQSERAGRIAEARDRWASAQMHAESLTSRHPTSRWVEDALLVRGRALVHLSYFSDAVPVLEDAVRRATRPGQRDEAFLLLGEASLPIRRFAEARQAFDSVLASGRPGPREEALLLRGRALLGLGKPDSALLDLRASTHPHARYDLARLLLARGDTADAGALYDALVPQRPYVAADWRPALDSMAAAGMLTHAAELVDRLTARKDLGDGDRARLLLDDATRRLRGAADTAGALGRFQAVASAAPDSVEAKAAAVMLAQVTIARAANDSELGPPRERLQTLTLEGGEAGQQAGTVLRMASLVDTLGAAATAPDAFWFERAEVLRDSLHAGLLAAMDFAEMARLFPASPWAAKGLVAAIAGGHPAADSLRGLLERRFGASPYALAVAGSGAGAEAFASLEDSLRRTLAQRAAPAGRGDRRVRRGDDVGDEPLGRRQPGDVPVPRRPDQPVPPPAPVRPDSGRPAMEPRP